MSGTSSFTRTAFRALGAVAVVTLVASLAGCGKSDGPVAAPETSGTATAPATSKPDATTATTATTVAGSGTASTTAPSTAGSSTGPSAAPTSVVATIPAKLPEDLKGQVGEVELIGTALPSLGKLSIEGDPARGTKAPVLIGKGFDGKEIRIDAVQSGRPTLIFFLAHWCPHCNNEIPILNDLRDSNAFRPDLDIYGVSTAVDPAAANFPPSEWVKKLDWTYPTIVDGVAADGKRFLANQTFGSSGFPFAVLINADGTVAARWSGEASGEKVISNINTYLAY